MKALSLYPDYAGLICDGMKTIECRTWQTDYRGDILICSNAHKIKGTIPGHAICIAELYNIRPFKKADCDAAVMPHSAYRPGLYAWELRHIRMIKPIPIKGKLSLFNADVDEQIEIVWDDVRDQDMPDEEAAKLINNFFAPLIV